MKFNLPCVLAFIGAASAASIPPRASGPSVTIKNGTVVGQSDGKIDSFLGIPYAHPPTGTLRLKLPQTITKSYGTLKLPATPSACPQYNIQRSNTSSLPPEVSSFLQNFNAPYQGPQGEDCLTVNVQRPANVSPKAKLPVLLWIYGGAYQIGSTNSYDGSILINRSIAMKEPIMFVQFNYRVNAFGFLGGKQLQKEGNTNLGLHDQRLAIQWVAENIAAFGGDPDRVVLWGESAGSVSVYDQLLINGGDNTYKGKPLFRGAIMDSGSIYRADAVDAQKPQAVFDQVASLAGCSPSNTTDPVGCLRAVSYDKLYAAMNMVPGQANDYLGLNIAYNRRPDPNSNFYPASPEVPSAKGAFARVPMIIGDQEDEGTIFATAQQNITTDKDLVDYFTKYWPKTPRSHVAEYVSTYPSAAAGSPFGTGDKNNIYPQYKRNAAIQGDVTFTLERRLALELVSPHVPAWSYLNTYAHDFPILGTYHTADLGADFFLQNYTRAGLTTDAYYINFVNSLDPNAGSSGSHGSGAKQWPKWDSYNRQVLNISFSDVTYIKDDFRSKSYDVLTKYLNEFRA